MLKKTLVLISTILFLSSFAFSQAKKVDAFSVRDDSIVVFFYDPLVRLNELEKDFEAKTDKQKSDALDKYLHENPLYLFKLTNNSTKQVRFLTIRGDPSKVGTKMFYKVEVIDNVPLQFSPMDNNYANKISAVVDKVNCGGTLFEHMSLFDLDQNKKLVGKGILLFGYFRRVQPYSEIKTSITSIIEQLQPKK